MKKLLLLALIMLGGVMTANAANITRRIWAYCDWGGQWQSTNNSIRIHYYQSNGNDITSWEESGSQYMSRFNSTNWFFYDITADESVLESVRVIIRANSGDEQTVPYNNEEDIMNLVNKCYKLKVEYDEVGQANRATVSELKYYLYNTTTSVRTEMSTTDCCTFTATIDNQTSPVTNYYVVAPSFAFSDDFSSTYWALVFRPWAEHQNLTFENVTDRTFFAEDGNNNTWSTNNQPAHFELSLNTMTWKYAISPYVLASIGSLGYATFSSPYDVAVDGVTASYITGVGANNVLIEEFFTDGIPANTGALLCKAGGGTVTFTPAASTPTDVSSTNKLVAVASNMTLSQTADSKTNYILTNQTSAGEKTIGFYKVNSANNNPIAAGKAYLALDTPVAAREYFWIGEEASAINFAETAIQNVEGYYNLNGQRIAQPTKGLYIVNGKKVILK